MIIDDKQIEPSMHEGIAYCSSEECPQYDGKRCELIGFRPHGICEPWVKALVAELQELKSK